MHFMQTCSTNGNDGHLYLLCSRLGICSRRNLFLLEDTDNCDVFILKRGWHRSGRRRVRRTLCPWIIPGRWLLQQSEEDSGSIYLNPLNTAYPEWIYRTGDLVKYNDRGELIYLSRKDFQIKHMGYRIELGEIESSAWAVDKLKNCACIYDETEDKIIFIYEGKVKEDALIEAMNGRLPNYMRPNRYIRVRQMPYNANGKIDRKYLKGNYNQL